MKLGQGNIFSSVCQEFCLQLVAAAETHTVGKRAVRILLECFLVSDLLPGDDQPVGNWRIFVHIRTRRHPHRETTEERRQH